jgi:hypothetical protein
MAPSFRSAGSHSPADSARRRTGCSAVRVLLPGHPHTGKAQFLDTFPHHLLRIWKKTGFVEFRTLFFPFFTSYFHVRKYTAHSV